jgi:exopolysaccharide/PEP-CTERM locus tyrosine autokinase
MGKIAEALEKAGYQEDSRQNDEGNAQGPQEQPQSSIPAVDKKSEKTTQSAQALCGKWDERLFNAVNDDIYIPEVFKILRSRILHSKDEDKPPKTIMVTSAVPKEGKSFITANLGISLAHGLDQHSLLVDCDLRKPTLATLFGLDNDKGLVDYLRDDKELSGLIKKTSMEKLSILTSGKPPVNPAELLSSSRMNALVKELSSRYEDRLIIFDSPPILIAAESSVLAGQVDAVILVVRQGGAGAAKIQKVINLIGPERVLGIVFNDRTINYFEKALVKGYGYYY